MFGAIFYVYKKEVQKMNDLIELNDIRIIKTYYVFVRAALRRRSIFLSL